MGSTPRTINWVTGFHPSGRGVAALRHGMPPAELRCELAALGLEQVLFQPMQGLEAYFSAFRIARPKPQPEAIKSCKDGKSA